jgi:putative spermidine/putrescine transport system ATP-binding protein
MNAVELKGLSKNFGAGTTIGPVTLGVAQGELLSLLGPSGCGKTTVLRMIAGFVQPTSGSISLRGEDITAYPPHRRGAALVFQNFALFPHLSVFDNIAFGLRRRGVARSQIAPRVELMIAMLQLDGLARRLPAALSGGQQQRVALARALVTEPAVLLLDEPFSSLDAKLREETRSELRKLQQRLGFTGILVTHDQAEALAISDRVAVMDKGRLVQLGTAQDIYFRPASLFVANFVGRANQVPGGIVRPESIRILPEPSQRSRKATVEAAAFLGSGSELTVRTTEGLSLMLIADGGAPARYPAGASIDIDWADDAVITIGVSS